MATGLSRKLTAFFLFIQCTLCLLVTGCHTIPPVAEAPTELTKITHPDYRIAPPDTLLVDAANLIPRPPYRIAPLDGLLVRVTVLAPQKDQKINELLPGQPIDGLYRVEVTGEANLGFDYGSVVVGGKTIPEAKDAIQKHLKLRFKADFSVVVALAESRALQQIRGEHLVRQDGKVTLGIYGSVSVSGMTLEEAKLTIEAHLSQFLFEPAVSVDVTGYNSKVYYVIVDLGLSGRLIYRLPITGNETVLDALGQIRMLYGGTDPRSLQVSRRAPVGEEPLVMPVDWNAIVRGGSTATNYQLLPGDRVYVNLDRWVAVNQYVSKVLAPVERILGVTLLGHGTVDAIATPLGSNGGINNAGR